jgi:hypothetical protein
MSILIQIDFYLDNREEVETLDEELDGILSKFSDRISLVKTEKYGLNQSRTFKIDGEDTFASFENDVLNVDSFLTYRILSGEHTDALKREQGSSISEEPIPGE